MSSIPVRAATIFATIAICRRNLGSTSSRLFAFASRSATSRMRGEKRDPMRSSEGVRCFVLMELTFVAIASRSASRDSPGTN